MWFRVFESFSYISQLSEDKKNFFLNVLLFFMFVILVTLSEFY